MDSIVYASVAAMAATTGSTLIFPPSIKAVVNGYVTWVVLTTIISVVSPAHKFIAADTIIWIPHYVSLGIAIRRIQLWLEFTSDGEDGTTLSTVDEPNADISQDSSGESDDAPSLHVKTLTSDDIIAEYIDDKKSFDEVADKLSAFHQVGDIDTDPALPKIGQSPTLTRTEQ
jgi:hypothetical protein